MVEMLSSIIKYAVQGAILDSSALQKNVSYFFVDDEDPCDNEDEEILFCKNNVCVHLASSPDLHVPGYLCIKSRTRASGRVRLLVTWTPNSQLAINCEVENKIELPRNAACTKGLLVSEEIEPLEVFSVDLSEMKLLKLFYDEGDPTSGQFVIGNLENHYKVFNFHCGGLNRVTQILEDWKFCSSESSPSPEGIRKRCFVVNPRITIKDDCHPEEGRYDPMPVEKWRTYFNSSGQIEDVANFRKAVFFGGLSPEVRKDAWKFLLFYYQFNSNTAEREQWTKEKTCEYQELNQERLDMTAQEHETFWRKVQCTVDKDVVRTDRSHPYFAGESNPNVQIMRNILLNYAVHNPSVGYNQGMSDLLASVLAVIQDEVDAFWCFVGLMEVSVFVTTPKDDAMDNQLLYLRELLRLMEPKFYAHALLDDDSMSMLFCHRWLLLCFKREFFDAEVLHMWEACWSRYQTEFFHIFLCVALVEIYGGEVVKRDMSAVDMLQYFTDLSMKMEGGKVLRCARQLLRRFRQLPYIPCTLRGLLSGPGIWDSAPLPEIECSCHRECQYVTKKLRRPSQSDGHLFNESDRELNDDGKEKHEDEKPETRKGLSSEGLLDEKKTQLNGVEGDSDETEEIGVGDQGRSVISDDNGGGSVVSDDNNQDESAVYDDITQGQSDSSTCDTSEKWTHENDKNVDKANCVSSKDTEQEVAVTTISVNHETVEENAQVDSRELNERQTASGIESKTDTDISEESPCKKLIREQSEGETEFGKEKEIEREELSCSEELELNGKHVQQEDEVELLEESSVSK